MTDNETPDPAKLLKLARQAYTSSEYRKKFHVADFWGQAEWYEPQLRFFTAGAKQHQRLIRGGNQTGKSFCCAFEAGLHMTGQYPRWWTGQRFNKPTRGWVIGPERTLVRDGPQKKLTAMQGEFGTGTIPLAAFTGRPIMVPGGTGSIDTMSVAHETDGARDGISTATFKSFEQGCRKDAGRIGRLDLDRRTLLRGDLFRTDRPHHGNGRHRVPVLHAIEWRRRAHLPIPQ